MLTYTDSNTALCNEENACNPLCVTAEVLNNAVTDEGLRMYKSSGLMLLLMKV